MKYYTPMTTYVMVMNSHVIPLLLQMRWFGQKPNNEIHLEIHHPEEYGSPSTIMRISKFHKVIWDDINDSESSSFTMIRLRLEGLTNSEKIFALLKFNLKSPNDGNIKIVLSPIPFGTDGQPKLPYKDEILKMFLAVAKIVLSNTCSWDIGRLKIATEATKNYHLKAPLYSEATFYLDQLVALGLARYIDSEHIEPIIAPSEFETIFGVKLPEIE